MKIMWCWRCRQDVPMLDEDEYAIIHRVIQECFARARQWHGMTLDEGRLPLDELFEPVRAGYARMTGMANCHHNAIMHHRIAIYGPACAHCGKPLRTPRASFCAACGAPVSP